MKKNKLEKKENTVKNLRFCDVIKTMFEDGTMEKSFAISMYKLKHMFDGTIFESKEPDTFLVGSGSNFNVYSGYSYKEILKIYKKLPCFYSTGSLVGKSEAYCFLLEQYYAMESSTGYVYCYIIPINNIIFNKVVYNHDIN